MALPIVIPSGYIVVYGESVTSNSGIVVDSTRFRFGSVYQVWSGGETFVYGGDEVMFDKGNVEARLAYPQSEYLNYNLIKADLATKQQPLL